MDSVEIKGLVNPEKWDNIQDKNGDEYGGACVQVARNVMVFLDSFEGEFNIGYHSDKTTPHGIVCACDDVGGLSGFMAGTVRNCVTTCYRDGWKFWLADVLTKYDIDDQDTCSEKVGKVVGGGFASKTEAEAYVLDLRARHAAHEHDRTKPYYEETARLFTSLELGGWTPTKGHDGGDGWEPLTDVRSAVAMVLSVDTSNIVVKHGDGRSHSLFLVLGNEPGYLVSDFSYNEGAERADFEKILDDHCASYEEAEA